MSIIRLFIVVGLAGGGYSLWKHHHESAVLSRAASESSANGFIALPPVTGQTARKVYVVAAENCQHEDAQRADRLAEDLARKGIAVERTHHISFNFESKPDDDVLAQMNHVMNGPLPAVFINGKAKSNPSIEEVVSEFNSTR